VAGAIHATTSFDVDLRQTSWAFTGGRVFGLLGAFAEFTEVVEWLYDQEEYDCRRQEKTDQDIQKVTVLQVDAVNREGIFGERLGALDSRKQWCQEILNQGIDNRREGRTNDHGDCQINDIAA